MTFGEPCYFVISGAPTIDKEPTIICGTAGGTCLAREPLSVGSFARRVDERGRQPLQAHYGRA